MKYWAHFLFSLFLQYSSTTVCAQVAYVEAVDLKGKFQTTMCLILVGLTSVGLLMLMLSLYIRHCTEHFNSGRHTVTYHCTRGFNREIIDKCPVFPYSTIKDLKIGRGTLECAVCLTEFEDTDNVRFLPKCNHVFHQDCIDVWLQSHMNCPVCRNNLTSDVVSIDIPNQEEGQSSRNNVVVIGEPEVEPEPEPDSTDSNGTGVEVVIPARESRMLEKLPRSHSTGHSLEERYTLRLPEEVRRNILGNHGRMRSSDGVILPGAWSGKNVERWSLSMSPTCWMPVVCQGASTSTLPV